MSSSIPTAEVHFLGQIEFAACEMLQQRLVFEAGGRAQPRMFVLLAEHPPCLTIGRAGSREQIRLSADELTRRNLEVRYLNRGGGCCLHAPGQLAVYPIVPLDRIGWSVGDLARRLRDGFLAALTELGIRATASPGRICLVGRSGPLVVFGLAVRYGVSCHGAFLNIAPEPGPFGYIDVLPANLAAASGEKPTQSSLLAERGRAMSMPHVRTSIVTHLAAALGSPEFHLHTGHPLLAQSSLGFHPEP